jgi:hypothetical protein
MNEGFPPITVDEKIKKKRKVKDADRLTPPENSSNTLFVIH